MWSLHVEVWRRSGFGIRKYCREQRLTENTFRRWLKRLVGDETALKLEKYQTELRRERCGDERETARRKQTQRRFVVTTDVRDRASQAFWAMHVEAMNWSGMGVRAYAAALQLSRIRCANSVTDWTPARS